MAVNLSDVMSDPSKKKKSKKGLPTQYGTYSGIVNEKGKTIRNPTETQSITNMVGYMKNNRPPEAEGASNVYRPKFSHVGLNYDRKKKQSDA
jgi:hypothetical protein